MSHGDAPNREIAEEIIGRVAEGEFLREILRSDRQRYPTKSTFYLWLQADEELAALFKAARDDGADAIAEQSLAILDAPPERIGTDHGDKIDPAHVALLKARAEHRIKLLAKWFPQKYGDKLTTEHTGPGGGPVQTVTRIERRIVKPE